MKKTVILFILFSLVFTLPAYAGINDDLIASTKSVSSPATPETRNDPMDVQKIIYYHKTRLESNFYLILN